MEKKEIWNNVKQGILIQMKQNYKQIDKSQLYYFYSVDKLFDKQKIITILQPYVSINLDGKNTICIKLQATKVQLGK